MNTSEKVPRLKDYPLIYNQEFEHDDGYVLIWTNDTKDKGLTETISFMVQGLKMVVEEGSEQIQSNWMNP